MKILVIGAGVLGSLFAARLHLSGQEVTLLARGRRLAEVKEHGLELVEDETGVSLNAHPRVTAHLGTGDAYDLVLVVVRKNQVQALLPTLAANTRTPNVLFLTNNAAGPQELTAVLGRERVLLGFPGAGGGLDGRVVRYRIAPAKALPTTIGEPDGRITPRLEQIAGVLQNAGFPVAISTDIDAWLKTHVAVVSPIANALYLAGGDNYRLARTQDGLVLMVRAVREGLRALRVAGIPITPGKYRLLEWIPEPVLVAMVRRSLNTPQAELALARHANHARDEMQYLTDELRTLAHAAHVRLPASDRLYAYLNPLTPPLPEGSRRLDLDQRQTAGYLVAGAAVVAAIWWLSGKRK